MKAKLTNMEMALGLAFIAGALLILYRGLQLIGAAIDQQTITLLGLGLIVLGLVVLAASDIGR